MLLCFMNYSFSSYYFLVFLFVPPFSLLDLLGFFPLLPIPFFPQDLNYFAIKAEQICGHPINNQATLIAQKWRSCLPAPFSCLWCSGEKGLICYFCCSHHLHASMFFSILLKQDVVFSRIIPHPPLHRGLCYCKGLSSAQGSVGAACRNSFQGKSVQGWGLYKHTKGMVPSQKTWDS